MMMRKRFECHNHVTRIPFNVDDDDDAGGPDDDTKETCPNSVPPIDIMIMIVMMAMAPAR